MHVLVLYNQPLLQPDNPDSASEAGVLESVDAASSALSAAGHSVRRLGLASDIRDLWQAVGHSRPDAIVNFCEGFGGAPAAEPYVAGALELIGIPYTGSGPECLALVRNKARTKWILEGLGLPTAAFQMVSRDSKIPRAALTALLARGPVIVKPAAEDASLGIGPESVVSHMVALERQIGRVRERYGDVLVEQFISGREFNVGIVAVPAPRALPLAEIEFRNGVLPVVTYEAKWSVGSEADLATQARCPAHVEPELADELCRVSLAAFTQLGCRDYGRVDLRVSAKGEIYVLEVNGNPDLAPTAGLARALRAAGISYDQFICQLVETAAARASISSLKSQISDFKSQISNLKSPIPDSRFRPLDPADVPALTEILNACGVFRPDEMAVGREVLDDAAGGDRDYHVIVATVDDRPVGWSCHGLVPLTDATYDLYWIAVHPDFQSHGVGRKLVREIARQLADGNARWLLAETSGQPSYEKTRQFYLRAGFELLSTIPDFYHSGDARLIYGLRI
jgi:D-alanine-D-alanine ligase